MTSRQISLRSMDNAVVSDQITSFRDRKALRAAPDALHRSRTAKEIDAAERTLRDWLSNGAPHLKDATGRIWIHGREFADWVNRVKKSGSKQKTMKENEGYCMHCRSHVEMLATSTRYIRGKLTMTSGTCSQCGRIIHRGGRTPTNSAPNQQGVPNHSHE